MEIGKRIKQLRGSRSREKIAEDAGIDQGTLYRIESGKGIKDPGFHKVERIVRALGAEIQIITTPASLGGADNHHRDPQSIRLQRLEEEVLSLRGDVQVVRQWLDRFRASRLALEAIEGEEAPVGLARAASRKKRGKPVRGADGGRKAQ